MPEGNKLAAGVVVAVVVIAAAFFLLQGDDGDAPDTGDASAGTHDCQTDSPPQQQGTWGGVNCQQASGAGTFTDTFTCEVPGESAVAGSLQEATAGTLHLTAEDAAGETVFEDTYTAGTHPVGDFVGEGEAGEWTVTVQLSEDWSSQAFGIGVGCSTQEEQDGQRSAPSGSME